MTTFDLPYDYNKIMHCGHKDLSNDGKSPTIVPERKRVNISNREVMRELDERRIKLLYNCSSRVTTTTPATAPIVQVKFRRVQRPERRGSHEDSETVDSRTRLRFTALFDG